MPQPIPHPAVIALLTYNRENEKDCLDLESVVTKRWLKIAEETVYDYTLHAHPPAKENRNSSATAFTNGSCDRLLSLSFSCSYFVSILSLSLFPLFLYFI